MNPHQIRNGAKRQPLSPHLGHKLIAGLIVKVAAKQVLAVRKKALVEVFLKGMDF